jgi:uncharacterized protein
MKSIMRRQVLIPLAVFMLLLAVVVLSQRKDKQGMISEFGKYQGYSDKVYDGAKQTSDYIALSNGTRLAYDLYIPTRKGMLADQPLPTLFKYTPYGRAWTVFDKEGKNNLAQLMSMPWYYDPILRVRAGLAPNGNVLDHLWRTKWLGDMVNSGYAVIVVDRPGTGASFGLANFAPEVGAKESDEILNWIAAQKWSNGNIGMFGDSIQAQIQFQAASTGNPHLKAILPATTWMDSYSALMFPGGIRDVAFDNFYIQANQAFDSLATPVDQDKDGALLAEARQSRQGTGLAEIVSNLPSASFRDQITPQGHNYWETYNSLYPFIVKINRAGVPFYLIDGWYDICDRDDLLIYANLTTPKRMLIRPVDHSEIESPGPDIDYGAEAHRWFDYWLKGIDNGIMKEPPIHYYVQGADKSVAWQSAKVWPPTNQEMTRYYFGDGKADVTTSINSGSLVNSVPSASGNQDAYTVDYSTTSGNKPRWSAPASPHKYPNMQANDAKALTYTTSPLSSAVEVVGDPIVRVWLSTKAPDLDIFAYLEEVDNKGNSTYVTEGNLRASLRALGQAPYDNLGLPFHTYFKSDQTPIPAGEPVELIFDLLPTGWKFSPGKQIRVTMTFADAGNFDTPVINPAPTIQLLRDSVHPSYVELPIMQAH